MPFLLQTESVEKREEICLRKNEGLAVARRENGNEEEEDYAAAS